MTDIKISIVVPVYNVKGYVEKCIESIIAQSYKNIEIILVDGSTDGSEKICDEYAQMDNRIKVIHGKNAGLVNARKAGTAAATGDYILNVDGDDWIENDRIEVLVKEGIMPSGADMVHLAGYQKDSEEESVLINENIPMQTFCGDRIADEIFPYFLSDLKRGLIWNVWSWAVRSDLLKRNQELLDDRGIAGEDLVCICFCLLEAKSVTFAMHSGYHYVQRNSSLTHTAAVSGLEEKKILYYQLKERLAKCNVSKAVNEVFFRLIIAAIILENYDVLLKKQTRYLFPFPNVRKGDRIVIYGAGKVGYALMGYLSATDDYKVMLWVDKTTSRHAVGGWTVSPVEEIGKVKYNKIVIAVMFADTALEIKEFLKLRGIPEEKIAVMDASVFTEDMIPDEIKCM